MARCPTNLAMSKPSAIIEISVSVDARTKKEQKKLTGKVICHLINTYNDLDIKLREKNIITIFSEIN